LKLYIRAAVLKHTTTLMARYKETDQMGVVYYSNYFVWFEVARTEFFRAIGYPYSRIEKEMALRLMVVKAVCSYMMPAHYDDCIDIECIVSKLGNTSIAFRYNILRGKDLLADGETEHVFTDIFNKPKRIPDPIKEALR
jgi:acyl-CoA thioester hydrolase